ncbi:MAG: TIGR02678 family protein [Propionibacteriaceae bacterium]|jgi:hypothetical protein|nr:TIGR02678 family protein [Propionibacteriaceae bacterium]
MTVASFYQADLGDRQAAFRGLLAHPLVAPWTYPDLFSLVSRHEKQLELWCKRLSYRLVCIDQCFRLRRVPLAGALALPRGLPSLRRTLVLALLAAAILEDERADSITLQEISDAVRRFAFVNGFREYDPDERRHRLDLVAAVRYLRDHGILEQRTQRTDLIDSWEREGTGIGAGYVIHRDALVLLVDTRDAELALGAADAGTDTRGPRLLRQLVETQALETGDLTEDEAAYLATQRPRLVDQAEEMTGGVVEIRQDVWTLVFPSDQGLDQALLIGFPEPRGEDWVALALLDAVARAGVRAGGRVLLASAGVDEVAATLHREQAAHLTAVLRESPGVVREAAGRVLREAGLLEVDAAGGWCLLPAAGRYREARLETPDAGEAAGPVGRVPSPRDEPQPLF